jgi:hypothetical protein
MVMILYFDSIDIDGNGELVEVDIGLQRTRKIKALDVA